MKILFVDFNFIESLIVIGFFSEGKVLKKVTNVDKIRKNNFQCCWELFKQKKVPWEVGDFKGFLFNKGSETRFKKFNQHKILNFVDI